MALGTHSTKMNPLPFLRKLYRVSGGTHEKKDVLCNFMSAIIKRVEMLVTTDGVTSRLEREGRVFRLQESQIGSCWLSQATGRSDEI